MKIYLFALFVIFLVSFAYADSNGVWHNAEDIRPGVIGDDENDGTYTFEDAVNFQNTVNVGLGACTNLYSVGGVITCDSVPLNLQGVTQRGATTNLAISAMKYADSNDAAYGLDPSSSSYSNIFAANVIDAAGAGNSLRIRSKSNCGGKLYTDSNGYVQCGTDNVNDADSDPSNEIQALSRSGSTVALSLGGGSVSINDGDYSPTNELQTLSISGHTLSISSKNSVSLPVDKLGCYWTGWHNFGTGANQVSTYSCPNGEILTDYQWNVGEKSVRLFCCKVVP